MRMAATSSWERKENPQAYDIFSELVKHPKASQHMLGIVGGNEVALQRPEIQVDIESDLRGITRANTFTPSRQHQFKDPKDSQNSWFGGLLGASAGTIERDGIFKGKFKVAPSTTPLTQSQMWAYPAVLAPEPFKIQSCNRPEKY